MCRKCLQNDIPVHLKCIVLVSSFCFLHFKRIVHHTAFVSADNQTRIKSRCRAREPFRSDYYWFSVLTLFRGHYFSHTMYNNASIFAVHACFIKGQLYKCHEIQHHCRHFKAFVFKILHWINGIWLQLIWLSVYYVAATLHEATFHDVCVMLLWHSMKSFKTAPTCKANIFLCIKTQTLPASLVRCAASLDRAPPDRTGMEDTHLSFVLMR